MFKQSLRYNLGSRYVLVPKPKSQSAPQCIRSGSSLGGESSSSYMLAVASSQLETCTLFLASLSCARLPCRFLLNPDAEEENERWRTSSATPFPALPSPSTPSSASERWVFPRLSLARSLALLFYPFLRAARSWRARLRLETTLFVDRKREKKVLILNAFSCLLIQAGAIWGLCIGPYDARRMGICGFNQEPILLQRSKFHLFAIPFASLTFFFFLVILCRPFWDASRVLCGMEVDLTSFYCNVLARFSLDGYLCNCVDWIGRRNRSASSASNAVKIPRDCNLDRHKRCALFMNWMNEIANCFWHLYCFSVNGKRRIVSVFCKLLWHWVVFSGKIFVIHNCYILAGNVIASD